ncbi:MULTISPECIES: NAD(P)-dependent oxidoreductase [Natrialbaceae]|uniref:NAD(P)-dependent oxidoreductase n=1 Tax=Natrialbaceae TaxID=1644061 RepID=UPI00207CDF8A|nr:NAD(P)-dependent oxidoreductase [Natronococcus sp. CG52]
MGNKHCLLCGDPQQPSEYMYESMSFLEGQGVTFERTDWHSDSSASKFRDVTMDMEERGPNDYDASEIVSNLDGVEYLVVHKAPVSQAVFEAGDDLEVVGAARGGVENIDLEAAEKHDVTVLHAPGRNANAVSDYAVSFACSVHRRIPYFVETTNHGEWALEFNPENLPRDLKSLTIGIIGFGNIGRQVAKRWAGFGPDIVAYDPFVDDEVFADHGVSSASLDKLLGGADIVTLHARLSKDTKNLLSEAEFSQMKETGLLVNTARGGLVDTDAIVDALESGEIGGAALDVFDEEPLPESHPLLDIENAWLSPHTAGSTRDAVLNGSKIIASDLELLLAGEEPQHRFV